MNTQENSWKIFKNLEKIIKTLINFNNTQKGPGGAPATSATATGTWAPANFWKRRFMVRRVYLHFVGAKPRTSALTHGLHIFRLYSLCNPCFAPWCAGTRFSRAAWYSHRHWPWYNVFVRWRLCQRKGRDYRERPRKPYNTFVCCVHRRWTSHRWRGQKSGHG